MLTIKPGLTGASELFILMRFQFCFNMICENTNRIHDSPNYGTVAFMESQRQPLKRSIDEGGASAIERAIWAWISYIECEVLKRRFFESRNVIGQSKFVVNIFITWMNGRSVPSRTVTFAVVSR